METEILDVKSVPEISELKILTIRSAAALLGIDKADITHAMELYVQSNGRDGLPYMERGARRSIRAGALKEYLMKQERKVLYA